MPQDLYETVANQVIFAVKTTGKDQRLDVTTFTGDVTLLVRRIAEKGYKAMSETLNNRVYVFAGAYIHRRIYPVIDG